MQTYHYIIDLNERGIFKCHVENAKTGKIIFEFNNEEEEDGLFWLVEDGFMDNYKDMSGLHEYLSGLKIIKPDDEILYIG